MPIIKTINNKAQIKQNTEADDKVFVDVPYSVGGGAAFNYISNPDAETNTSLWSTYQELDAVTFQDSGDTVTLNNHGLNNNIAISFTSIVTTTGISINTTYYVINTTTNTFQVSSTVGGSALPLTNNGSGILVRSIPKIASGGSPNITWTRSNTNPLRGDASFVFTKDASSRQGQGVQTNFTIENADLAKILTITFDYNIYTGTYSEGDLTVYLIQDPTGTPKIVQPSGYKVQSASNGTKMKHIATFQTDSSATSYRLCFHVASTSALAYTVQIDNVVVSPQTVQYGAPVTDWQPYIPLFNGLGTCTTIECFYRRVGQNLEIKGRFLAGTIPGTADEVRIGLPPALSVLGQSIINTCGIVSISRATAVNEFAATVKSGDTYITVGPYNTTTHSPTSQILSNQGYFNNGDTIGFWASMPIQGWSSTVQMSNDTDTRVVSWSGYLTSNTAVTNGSAIPFVTEKDSHGTYSSGLYTVPVSGDYSVVCGIQANSGAGTGTASIYINGNPTKSISQYVVADFRSGAQLVTGLKAGDIISIRPNVSTTLVGTANGGGSASYAQIFRLSGPSAIAASEKIAARYRLVSTSISCPTGAFTNINFNTKDFDTHGAVITGLGVWKFIAPASGIYRVSSLVTMTTADYNGSSGFYSTLYKTSNGTSAQFCDGKRDFDQSTGIPWTPSSSLDTLIYLLAGESIDVRMFQNSGGTATTLLDTNGWSTYINIERIGN